MFRCRNELTTEFIKNNSSPDKETGCWNWSRYVQSGGYGQVRFGNKQITAHRASYLVFKGEFCRKLCVCHTCDNPRCVNPEHLFLGTTKDNNDDSRNKGRAKIGVSGLNLNKGHSRIRKLTDVQVMEIYRSDDSLRELSEIYGVSMSTISTIRTGKRKQLVTDPRNNIALASEPIERKLQESILKESKL